MDDLLVLGTGLIGTSTALAVAGLRQVHLHDEDPAALRVALERTGARAWDGRSPVGLVVAAVPAAAVAGVLADVRPRVPGAVLTHVSSVQAAPQAEVETALGRDAEFCGGHPLAGRETSGPAGATADLFEGRPWAVCRAPWTSDRAAAEVERLARQCRALPVALDAAEHDAAVALVSHLPQVTASVLAAQLLGDPGATVLGGPGLQDTTRLAATAATWWPAVLAANGAALAPLLRAVARDLEALAAALDVPTGGNAAHGTAGEGSTAAGGTAAAALLERGRRGRSLVRGKRSAVADAFVPFTVELPDEPGALARLFAVAAEAGVNVEDVRLDHAPGSPRGAVQLLVRPEQVDRLRRALP